MHSKVASKFQQQPFPVVTSTQRLSPVSSVKFGRGQGHVSVIPAKIRDIGGGDTMLMRTSAAVEYPKAKANFDYNTYLV